MIIVHLFAGLVFGVLSVLYSIYAGHGFFVGLLRYSGIGACGICLSALIFWVRPWVTETAAHIVFKSGLPKKGLVSGGARQAGANLAMAVRGHRSGGF